MKDKRASEQGATLATIATGLWNSDVELVQSLLSEGKPLDISEDLVIKAATDPCKGKDIMQLLLEKKSDLPISEAVLVAAAKN